MKRSSSLIRLSLALIGVALPLANPGRASASILYGATNAGQLLTIDTATGAGTVVGNIGFGAIEALEVLSDGTMVGIANANQFIQINTTSGAGTFVANVGVFAWVEGLAYNSSNNVLYASATTGFADANRLITLNPATGQPTSIAPSFFGPSFWDVDGLAVSAGGTIYGSHINTPNPSLFSVDPVTGVGTLIGALSMAITGLDFAPDGTLYGVTFPDIQVGGPARLVTINPATGAIQDIGPIGFNDMQAIAFGPEADGAVPEVSSLIIWSLISGIGILLIGRCKNRIASHG